ncbi:MAG: DUF1540 domain-containing protein [Clostridia bacterium]|nr:DUF1540 domain-containing protein [Clostridia bacterium]
MAKINCSVGSCEYNAKNKNECTLKTIQVSPCRAARNGQPEDETFCHSYSENH